MADRPQQHDTPSLSPQDWAQALLELADRGQKVFAESVAEQTREGGIQIPDPMVVTKAFLDLRPDPAFRP